MTIHYIYQDAQQDTSQTGSTATPYDTIWNAQEEVPTQEPPPLERVMLAEDKLYVVLAVVLIIWFGVLFLLFRTNRRIRHVEKKLEHEDE